MRLNYKTGDKVGPNNIIFIQERTDLSGRRICDFICPYCNQIFSCSLYNIKSGNTYRCKNCALKSRAEKRSYHLENQKFGFLTVLKKSDKRRNNKILWECQCCCGTITYVTTQDLVSGKSKSCGCKSSLLLREKVEEDISGKIYNYWEALYPSEKRNSYNRRPFWFFKCLNCGNIKEVNKFNVLNGLSKSCGCIKSHGEEKIAKILVKNNINFITQKTFSDCYNPKTNALLKFDFFLPDTNVLIEYDGKQHFQQINIGWGHLENLEDINYRDKIKDSWAINHSKYLIRIPYTDYDLISYDYLFHKIAS